MQHVPALQRLLCRPNDSSPNVIDPVFQTATHFSVTNTESKRKESNRIEKEIKSIDTIRFASIKLFVVLCLAAYANMPRKKFDSHTK